MFINKPMAGVVNQQVALVPPPTPNLFWPMQEGSGTTTTDTIASAVVTFSSCTWSVAGGRNGTNCIEFANGQWAYIADPFFYDPHTICFWAYPTAAAAYKVFMSKRNTTAGVSSTAEWEIFYDTSNRLSYKIWNSTPAEIFFIQGSTNGITLNAWNHIVCSCGGNGTTGYTYINGVLHDSGAQGSAMGNATSSVNFGGRTSNASSRDYNGKLQEVRIYNYQLSDTEVENVYNAATP